MNRIMTAVVTTIIYIVGAILAFALGWGFRALKARKITPQAKEGTFTSKVEKKIVQVANSPRLEKIEEGVFKV